MKAKERRQVSTSRLLFFWSVISDNDLSVGYNSKVSGQGEVGRPR